MAVKKFKPVTAGTRHKIIGTFEEITTNKPEKSLLSPKKSSGGRNNSGKMTVRYIGGGHKQMYRNIDFKRTKDGIAATVKSVEYDPNRTAGYGHPQYRTLPRPGSRHGSFRRFLRPVAGS